MRKSKLNFIAAHTTQCTCLAPFFPRNIQCFAHHSMITVSSSQRWNCHQNRSAKQFISAWKHFRDFNTVSERIFTFSAKGHYEMPIFEQTNKRSSVGCVDYLHLNETYFLQMLYDLSFSLNRAEHLTQEEISLILLELFDSVFAYSFRFADAKQKLPIRMT